ncbi:MAG TPA: hypothetical protein VFR02_01255, partial [bacterium]|nr:hypothetical protein [bacterium]
MSLAASFLNRPLSRDLLWEAGALGAGLFLLARPPLAHPQSFAFALGAGLFLLLWRTPGPGALGTLGPAGCCSLLYTLLASAWSLSPGLSWQSASFLFLGAALALMASSSSPEGKSRLELFGFLAALAAALWGLEQVLWGYDRWAAQAPRLSGLDLTALHDAERGRRAFGPLVTPGALAGLLILFIPWGFLQAWTRRGLSR